MNDDTLLEWAVARLATIAKNDEQPRMPFATVTCLNWGSPLPSITDAPEPFSIKMGESFVIHFTCRTTLYGECQ